MRFPHLARPEGRAALHIMLTTVSLVRFLDVWALALISVDEALPDKRSEIVFEAHRLPWEIVFEVYRLLNHPAYGSKTAVLRMCERWRSCRATKRS